MQPVLLASTAGTVTRSALVSITRYVNRPLADVSVRQDLQARKSTSEAFNEKTSQAINAKCAARTTPTAPPARMRANAASINATALVVNACARQERTGPTVNKV